MQNQMTQADVNSKQLHRRSEQKPSRNRRSGRKRKKQTPIWKNPIFLLDLLLVIGLIITLLFHASADRKLRQLRQERADEVSAYAQTVARHTVKYKDLIKKYAAQYQVHPAFIAAVILRESSYDPSATSGVGARGLMQLMEGTAGDVAGWLNTENYSFDRMYEPELNIQFGTRYIKYLSDKFDGDPVKIICAYHAGAGNVNAWLKKYSSDGVTLTLDQIPMDDTQSYARKVMNAYVIYYENYYQDGV